MERSWPISLLPTNDVLVFPCNSCDRIHMITTDNEGKAVVKMVDFSYKPSSAIDAVYAAPPSQQFKTTPPGNPTQEHRTDPRSSHRACLTTHDSPNRMGSLPPMLRCKRQSQLPRYRSPVRPHVLHALPHGCGEGDMYAIADGTYPSTPDALGTTKQATGQHQGRCSACAHVAAGNRPSQSVFRCTNCGHKANADVNAAKNIQRQGLHIRQGRRTPGRVAKGPSGRQERNLATRQGWRCTHELALPRQ